MVSYSGHRRGQLCLSPHDNTGVISFMSCEVADSIQVLIKPSFECHHWWHRMKRFHIIHARMDLQGRRRITATLAGAIQFTNLCIQQEGEMTVIEGAKEFLQ